MNAAEVKAAFLFDLNALLQKWTATLEAADHYPGYAECGEDIRMTVTIPGVWDANGDTLREWTEIDLGRHAKAAQAGKDVAS